MSLRHGKNVDHAISDVTDTPSHFGYFTSERSKEGEDGGNIFYDDDIDKQILLSTSSSPTTNETSIFETTQSWEREMLRVINTDRQKIGARYLCINEKLTAAAKKHTRDMAQNNLSGHEGSDGSKVGTRVFRSQYTWSLVAENIFYYNGGKSNNDYVSVSRVHNAWMSSTGHKKNILNGRFEHMGMARIIWSGTQYWVQVFGTSNNEYC